MVSKSNNTKICVNNSTQTDFIEIKNDKNELCKMISSKSTSSLQNMKKNESSSELSDISNDIISTDSSSDE